MIRQAVAGDLAALKRCVVAAYAPFQSTIHDLPPVSQGLADDIAQTRAWVVELKGHIAGVMVLSAADDFVHLANLAVDPAAQGQGLGRQLLAHAEACAHNWGQQELRLTTHALMPKTIAFYERLGWERVGQDGNKIMMCKTLPA